MQLNLSASEAELVEIGLKLAVEFAERQASALGASREAIIAHACIKLMHAELGGKLEAARKAVEGGQP